MAKGNRDLPIESSEADLFGLEHYYNGLANFIMECETPLTIAIQGDWGSGKTSMIKMVSELLNESCQNLYFNTWHYSHFSSEDDLSISFLSEMTKEVLKIVNAPGEILEKFTETLKNILKKVVIKANISLLKFGSVEMETSINDLFEFDKNFYEQIKNYKKDFEDVVNSYVKKNSKNRIVIFIDDLDRLDPQRAVELLEIIKIFLDVPGCVFVLAIDYEVVVLGVSKKYGDGLMFKKGKSFFDKMIQLPFHIPVDFYEMDKLLIDAFKNMGIDLNGDTEIIDGIIRNSVGANPRTVKRLMNTFELLKEILNVKKNDQKTNILLLAVLCIQLYDDALYRYFLSTREWSDNNQNTVFSYNSKDGKPYSEFLSEKLSLDEEQRGVYNFKKTYDLLKLLNNYIHENTGESGISNLSEQSDFETFENLLRQSQITSSSMVERSSYNQEILSNTLDLSDKVIMGYKIDGAEMERANSFTDAFVKIIEALVDESDFIQFIYNRQETKSFEIPDRMFRRLNQDKDNEDYTKLGYTKSSVKCIHGQDIILHYGRSDLRNYLLKFLKAFHVRNKIELVFKNTKEDLL